MVKKCLECSKQPVYNHPGEKQGIYCNEHKLPGMIDVGRKTCLECNTGANYGKLFSQKTHCAKHKKDNEFSNNNPSCEIENCQEQPYYTEDNQNYPKRCENHKFSDDKNIVEKPCGLCGLNNFLNEKNSLCSDCDKFNKPKLPDRKELIIKRFLENNNISFESHDKTVKSSQYWTTPETVTTTVCSLTRPDFILDYTFFKVCLEVDEFQHRNYLKECEFARMGNIHGDLGGTPLLFIRFNPDPYKKDGKTIREYKSRERYLLSYLKSLNEVKKLNYPLVITYFYYDNFDVNIVEYIRYDYYNKRENIVQDVFDI